MDTRRWSTLSALLDELLELEPDRRAARLAAIAAQDPDSAAELERMLALDDERPDFLSQSVVDANAFAPQPGQQIGPYRLERPLGEGGMGQVWLASRADGLYNRRVALKLLRPGLGDAGLRNRFNRERQILARLGHAHIARLLDAGVSTDGQPFLALDYVQGEPITDYAAKLAIGVPERLELFLQVCAAVSHAHANLVVHRDLKPSNILVTPAGEVCLLDFGIAKLLDEASLDTTEITGTGTRAFTLTYAAPEQLRNGVITTMTDVYSLGVVLYEVLTGRKPYEPERGTDAAWEEAILTADPVRPSVMAARVARESALPHQRRIARELAGDLDNILLRALAKLPEDRYVSVEALAQDLRRYLGGEPVLARPQSFPYRALKFLRRNSLAVSVGTTVTILMVASLAFVTWQAKRAVDEAERAQAMQAFVVALFEDTDQAGGGPSLDVRSLLDAGVRRADTELIRQPQLRAELLGLVARLRQGLGDDREALDLLDRQAQVLAGLGSDAVARIGLEAAALRGRSLRALGQPEVCIRTLTPWMAVSQDLALRHPREAAEYLSQLGRCRRALGGVDVARDLFGQALDLRRRGLADALTLQAESQADLAGLLADEGRYPEAIRAMREALDLLRESGGDRNALGVEIWRELGAFHLQIGDRMEAEASLRQSLEIALSRFGPQHPLTAGVQQPLGAVLVQGGKLDEAERMLTQAHERMLARFGPEHPDVAASWQLLGRLAWARNRLADAERSLQQSLQLRRRSNEIVLRRSVLCDLAEVRLALGQPESGERLARECLQLALGDQPRVAARAHLLLAEVARARGQGATAADALAAAVRELQAAGIGNGDPLHATTTIASLRLALESGDLAAAAARLEAVGTAPPADPDNDVGVHWKLPALTADLECRQGRYADGRARRKAVLGDAAAAMPQRLRMLEEIRALASACG
ncbi:serine/threonine-protein kinase [Arenimonas composti]|uniref:Protein kinase domain-containing protein n=1 Tax=Arenimonas composti TR7-09 = DSM 18010 TaxID=1121013 RepID=A0A091BIJ3_9GAMM|nr:serine/threonine-protein kinase [Arenimonas composti]KFN50604.1 hypothetical protein P873_05440 [Arenimonas composti TR7-09 = DSM 18010]